MAAPPVLIPGSTFYDPELGLYGYQVCNRTFDPITFVLCENPYYSKGPGGKLWEKRKCTEVKLGPKECKWMIYKAANKPDRSYTDFHLDWAGAAIGPPDPLRDGASVGAGPDVSLRRALQWLCMLFPPLCPYLGRLLESMKGFNAMGDTREFAMSAPRTLGPFLGGACVPVGAHYISSVGRNRDVIYSFPTPYPMRLLNFWGPRKCQFVIESITGIPKGWEAELLYPRLGQAFSVEPGDTAAKGVLRIVRPASVQPGTEIAFTIHQRVVGVLGDDPVYGFEVSGIVVVLPDFGPSMPSRDSSDAVQWVDDPERHFGSPSPLSPPGVMMAQVPSLAVPGLPARASSLPPTGSSPHPGCVIRPGIRTPGEGGTCQGC